jgi:hypothetical protein
MMKSHLTESVEQTASMKKGQDDIDVASRREVEPVELTRVWSGGILRLSISIEINRVKYLRDSRVEGLATEVTLRTGC